MLKDEDNLVDVLGDLGHLKNDSLVCHPFSIHAVVTRSKMEMCSSHMFVCINFWLARKTPEDSNIDCWKTCISASLEHWGQQVEQQPGLLAELLRASYHRFRDYHKGHQRKCERNHDDPCDSDPCDEYDLCEWIYGFANLFVNEFNLHIHIK